MGQRENIVKIAQKEVGYKESGNNNTKYGVWYGMNNNPWCSMFISWCAAQAKVAESIVPKLAYVPYMVDFYKKRNRYKKRGTYTPQPGDIVFFGDSDHVGFVEKVFGGNVITIEGNTSSGGNNSNGDGVYRRTRALNNSWIMGYGTPEYEEDEEVAEIIGVNVKNMDTGNYITVEAVNVAGSNYIKLRDVEKLFPVTIDWDGKSPTMKMNYNK